MNQKPNFAYTLTEVICLLLVIFGLGQFFPVISRWQFGLMNDWFSIGIYFLTVIITALVVTIAWHRKDPSRQSDVHIWIENVIAFYLVYMICGYAFAKILKTQFQPPNYVLDTPIGDLGGFWLTWTYFGFSETFAYILGYTQIAGCILLLFRKTRLLGTFVLIPVMVNICLIDHFYTISPLAYYNALHYTFMLFFILSLDLSKLIPVFFSTQDKLKITNWKFWALNTIRVLVLVLAFQKIYELRASFQPKTKLNGVWEIEKFSRSGKNLNPESLSDSAWTKIYFEWRYGCLMKYSVAHSKLLKPQSGDYTVNEQTSQLKITVAPNSPEKKKGDSLILRYYFVADSTLLLSGFYNMDSITLRLKKVK